MTELDKQMIADAITIVKNAELPREIEQTILNLMDKAPEIGWQFDTHHNAAGLVAGIAKALLYAWQVNQQGQQLVDGIIHDVKKRETTTEKQAMYLEEWHVATEQMDDLLDSIVSLAGEGRAFTIETLVSRYGKAQEQATRAMLEGGFKDYQDIMAAWIHWQDENKGKA